MSDKKGVMRGVTLLAAITLAAAACGGSSSGSGGSGGNGVNSTAGNNASFKVVPVKDGGSITYAADQAPTGFNDNTSKDIGASVINIAENIYPAVFKSAPDFTVHLNTDLMVSAGQTKASPQTIVYKIKPGAKWSDGVPIDAQDFIYLWQHRNGSNKSLDVASTTGYDQILSVTGSDGGKTVTVVFRQPFSEWKTLFSSISGGAVIPAHYMKTLGPDPAAWNDGLDRSMPISGGPFKIQSYQPGDSLTLARNNAYYGPKAHLDSIVFRFLPTSQTQPQALQNGEVQLIYPQPQLDEVNTVRNIPNVTSEINFGLSFEQLTFNFKNQFLQDKIVRDAIVTALDRKAIVTRTVGQFSPKAKVLGNRIWLTGQPQYVDHTPPDIGDGDVAKAKKMLEGDGYSLGTGGYFQKNGKILALRFSTTAGNQLREQTGEVIQSQMQATGVKITIANSPSTTFFGKDIPQGNFDIAQFAWIGTPFPISSNQPIYTCGSGENFGKYCNTRVDQLFSQAQSQLDTAKSANLANQIDEILWQDMATIPLYQKPTFIAFDSKYGNIHDNSTKEGPFYNSAQWGVKK